MESALTIGGKIFNIKDKMRDKTSAIYSQRDAEMRFKMVSDIEYDFILGLRKGAEYLGHATIRFMYTP